MTLNEEAKKTLREQIQKELSGTVVIERVKLRSDLLEQLLFKKRRMEDGTVVKIPVWSGDFLKKIDLSGISFENVVWNLTCLDDYENKYARDGYDIRYRETNAWIDFSKAYKMEPGYLLFKCDFSGTNLSKNEIDCDIIETGIFCCDFSNTGLRVKCDLNHSLNATVRDAIRKNFFANCYLNDTLLFGREKQDEILQVYAAMVQQYSAGISEAIQKAKKQNN